MVVEYLTNKLENEEVGTGKLTDSWAQDWKKNNHTHSDYLLFTHGLFDYVGGVH